MISEVKARFAKEENHYNFQELEEQLLMLVHLLEQYQKGKLYDIPTII